MKFRKYFNNKNFSKILAFWILLSSIHTNSFANVLSSDSRYETFEGDNITINDVLEEDKVDVEIEGNTLVNIADNSQLSLPSELKGWKLNAYSDRVATFYLKSDMLKPNTEYTVVFIGDMSKIYGSATTLQNVTENDNHVIGNSIYHSKYKYKITTNSLIHDSNKTQPIYLIPHIYPLDGEVFTQTQLDNLDLKVMIFEGDLTNKNTPDEYFFGIKSVGQNDVEDYNLEVISSNKNLFDITKWVGIKYGNYQSFNGIDYKNRTVTVDGIIPDAYTLTGATGDKKVSSHEKPFLIKVEPNTSYTLSFIKDGPYTGSNYIQQYDEDGNSLGIIAIGNRIADVNCIKTFITDSKTRYLGIRFGIQSTGNSITYSNIQLELSSDITNYEPSKENKKQIKLNEPLRGLPNGVKDRVVKRNGKWYIERNCREVILDGSEQWSTLNLNYYNNKNIGFSYIDIPNICINNNDEVTTISDRFYGLTYNSTYASETDGVEGISAGNIFKLYIFIDKNKLSTPDTSGLRDWLKNNPTTVIYQVAEPIYEPLNIDLTLGLYLETTYLSTNSTIPANLKFTVDRVANRAKEYSELAKKNPTSENIAIARMWANLMKESILKDGFQSDINSIVKIDDLSLEKKSSSSNIDLYIKSENSLVMTLNTNSIIFEDFSGVEDDIKENAVNISVSSSLPYQLNGYLATGIQNSDSSNTISKLILNIKESEQSEYKTFNALNDKVVLKDSCESGNNNQHNIDLKLNAGVAHEKDVYKTTIKFETEQI